MWFKDKVLAVMSGGPALISIVFGAMLLVGQTPPVIPAMSVVRAIEWLLVTNAVVGFLLYGFVVNKTRGYERLLVWLILSGGGSLICFFTPWMDLKIPSPLSFVIAVVLLLSGVAQLILSYRRAQEVGV